VKREKSLYSQFSLFYRNVLSSSNAKTGKKAESRRKKEEEENDMSRLALFHPINQTRTIVISPDEMIRKDQLYLPMQALIPYILKSGTCGDRGDSLCVMSTSVQWT